MATKRRATERRGDRRFERISAWVASRLSVQAVLSREDADLVHRIKDKAKTGEQKTHDAFVSAVFAKELRHIRGRARRWRSVAFVTALAVAAAGILSAVGGALGKGVGKGDAWSIVAIVAGSTATAFTAFNHSRQPDSERDRLQRARTRLQKEGWMYLYSHDAYQGKREPAAFSLFVSRVFHVLDDLASSGRGQRTGSEARK